jgi:hypothetical protein
MGPSCCRCNRAIDVEDRHGAFCADCEDALCASRSPADAADPPEIDHRGIQLPARTRVGGIITPQ